MAVTRTTPTTSVVAARPKAAKAPSFKSYFVPTEMPAICQLWLYRLLLKRPNLYGYLQQDELLYDGVLAKFGLSEQILQVRKPGMVGFILQRKCRELAADPSVRIPYDLAVKVSELGCVIGLNQVEQDVLALAVLLNTDDVLQAYAREVQLKQITCLEKMLQIMLAYPVEHIRAALKTNSALLNCGLLTLQFPDDLAAIFDFVTPNFPAQLQQMTGDPMALLKHLWQLSPPATLSFEDYPHITKDLELLRPYLTQALGQLKVGVNILLYGEPGVGKTELARLLAADSATNLYEVSSEDDDGDPIDGQKRLRAYTFAQRCLGGSNYNMMMFDEAEDVFNQNPFSRHYTERKRWFNKLLEQNPMPCLWITNDISEMDNAVLRRFDLLVEVTNLPKAQRAGLLHKASDGILSENEALALAANPALSPAVIQRTADVVKTFLPYMSKNNSFPDGAYPVAGSNVDLKKAFGRIINNTLKAQGHAITAPVLAEASQVYDPEFINADVDVSSLIAGLARSGNARICLYGPPGSGKTAFCQYLADQLEQPLLFKPASSLLSCYLGESEKLIAQAFAQASEEGAVLLLDEVDSFLQQRSKAEHNWQVTQVNELLQQMERFNGILLATTNQLPQLDQAALRRFDLIIEFNYLTAEQAMDLLHEYCKVLNLPLGMAALKQLQQLVLLTPQLTAGDYHAVARQARFRPLASADAFVAELQKMVRLKGGGSIVMPDASNRLQ